MTDWQTFREPLRTTLTRTVTIALVAGFVLALWFGGLSRWPATTALMLWPSLGGHLIELWFLNWLRPRISAARGAQIGARLAVWFVGGIVLGLGMWLTVVAFVGHPVRMPWVVLWWLAGLAFIVIELVPHLGLQLRGRPSFFNGRG